MSLQRLRASLADFRDTDELLTGARLAEASRWYQEGRVRLSAEAITYIKKSLDHSSRERPNHLGLAVVWLRRLLRIFGLGR